MPLCLIKKRAMEGNGEKSLLSLDNDQFHAPDASIPGKEPSVHTE